MRLKQLPSQNAIHLVASCGDKKAFSPNAECVVKGKQKKSVPTKSKPSTIKVVLLQDYQEDVPKGATRNKLKKCD